MEDTTITRRGGRAVARRPDQRTQSMQRLTQLERLRELDPVRLEPIGERRSAKRNHGDMR